jgi:membrane protein implicated in regulation of membrane protease activity
MEFSDLWLWLIFVIIGLFLVFIGSAFIIGGLVTWPFESWVLTLVVTSIICIAYVVLGRRYVHQWTAVRKVKTNIDTIIGQQGIVLKSISKNFDGRVRVSNEQWRARADKDIEQGEEITVTSISGVTLIVEKIEGGK